MELKIRNAKAEDAKEVAWIVLEALDIHKEASAAMVQLCSEKGTLYSWEHTRLVCVDGRTAGGLISYRGENYAATRQASWERFWDEDPAVLAAVPQECAAGEFYLDSMAVLPQYRGLGLGKDLMMDAIRLGQAQGCKCATLLAAKDKPGLVAYYEKLGFRKVAAIMFFGHAYWKMELSFLVD